MKTRPPGLASTEELRLDDLKALHLALLGQHVQKAQPSALASRIRQNLKQRLGTQPPAHELGPAELTPENIDTSEQQPIEQMSLLELQQRYRELLGHPARIHDRRHLQRVLKSIDGTNQQRSSVRGALQTLISIEALARIDDICQRLGIRSRAGFLRQAVFGYLVELGETETADLIAPSL